MIRKSTKQSSFLDTNYICERLVPQDSFYRKFRELVTPLIRVFKVSEGWSFVRFNDMMV